MQTSKIFLEVNLTDEIDRLNQMMSTLKFAVEAAKVTSAWESLEISDFRNAIVMSVEARCLSKWIADHLPTSVSPNEVERFRAMTDIAADYTRRFWRKFSLRQIVEESSGVKMELSPATNGNGKNLHENVTPKRTWSRKAKMPVETIRKFKQALEAARRANGGNLPRGTVSTEARVLGIDEQQAGKIARGEVYADVV